MTPMNSRHFQIGENMPGAPVFVLNLTFSDDGLVSGLGSIAQETNPPLDLHTYLVGHDMRFAWRAGNLQLIQLTGFAAQPQMFGNWINVKCTMVLDSDKPDAGTAQLQFFREKNGTPTVLKSLPVNAVTLVAA
jgi:hypothetical protein